MRAGLPGQHAAPSPIPWTQSVDRPYRELLLECARVRSAEFAAFQGASSARERRPRPCAEDEHGGEGHHTRHWKGGEKDRVFRGLRQLMVRKKRHVPPLIMKNTIKGSARLIKVAEMILALFVTRDRPRSIASG